MVMLAAVTLVLLALTFYGWLKRKALQRYVQILKQEIAELRGRNQAQQETINRLSDITEKAILAAGEAADIKRGELAKGMGRDPDNDLDKCANCGLVSHHFFCPKCNAVLPRHWAQNIKTNCAICHKALTGETRYGVIYGVDYCSAECAGEGLEAAQAKNSQSNYISPIVAFCSNCNVSVRHELSDYPVPCPACKTLIDPVLDNPPELI